MKRELKPQEPEEIVSALAAAGRAVYQPEQLRITNIRMMVPMSETMMEPRQPRRFEKKANTPPYRRRSFERFCTFAADTDAAVK